MTGGLGALAVTGSKGGVGKSNLVVNVAVALSRLGRRVLLVDGDLGLASLDVLLGLVPERTVEHLFRGEAALEELLLAGPDGVRILPAASGVPDLDRLDAPVRRRLLEALARGADISDDLLIDTGAGLGDATLSLALAASHVIVVTTPEPPSLVDAYASLKVLWAADPAKPIDLVVNQAASDHDAQVAYDQLARAAARFLGRTPGWLGPVLNDPQVGQAVRRQKAVLELYPHGVAARCYERIALQLAARAAESTLPAEYWQRLLDGAGAVAGTH